MSYRHQCKFKRGDWVVITSGDNAPIGTITQIDEDGSVIPYTTIKWHHTNNRTAIPQQYMELLSFKHYLKLL